MRLVVDANVLYSVVLKTDGAVAGVFFNTRPQPDLCSPLLLQKELIRHRPRIATQMGKSVAQVTEVLELLLRRVILMDASLVDEAAFAKARALVKAVDPDDEDYVALALHLKCPLWTGDMKLARALKGRLPHVLTTSEVRALHAGR